MLLGAMLGLCVVYAWKLFTSPPAGGRLNLVAEKPPEFPEGGTWLNSEKPLRLADLHGKVVWLQFGFLRCGYCRLMDPYLARWHEKYAPDGLVLIEIDDGETDSLAQVQAWVAADKISYPVLHDTNGAVCRRFGISGYPSMYLIGRDGKVLWDGGGWGGSNQMAALEERIRAALKD